MKLIALLLCVAAACSAARQYRASPRSDLTASVSISNSYVPSDRIRKPKQYLPPLEENNSSNINHSKIDDGPKFVYEYLPPSNDVNLLSHFQNDPVYSESSYNPQIHSNPEQYAQFEFKKIVTPLESRQSVSNAPQYTDTNDFDFISNQYLNAFEQQFTNRYLASKMNNQNKYKSDVESHKSVTTEKYAQPDYLPSYVDQYSTHVPMHTTSQPKHNVKILSPSIEYLPPNNDLTSNQYFYPSNKDTMSSSNAARRYDSQYQQVDYQQHPLHHDTTPSMSFSYTYNPPQEQNTANPSLNQYSYNPSQDQTTSKPYPEQSTARSYYHEPTTYKPYYQESPTSKTTTSKPYYQEQTTINLYYQNPTTVRPYSTMSTTQYTTPVYQFVPTTTKPYYIPPSTTPTPKTQYTTMKTGYDQKDYFDRNVISTNYQDPSFTYNHYAQSRSNSAQSLLYGDKITPAPPLYASSRSSSVPISNTPQQLNVQQHQQQQQQTEQSSQDTIVSNKYVPQPPSQFKPQTIDQMPNQFTHQARTINNHLAPYSNPAPQIPYSTTEPMPILKQMSEMEADGSFLYETLTGDQTHIMQQGHIENRGTDHEEQVMQGSYSFVGEDGRTYTVNYIADANGFRATGDHLPTPPPVPEVIQRSIEQNIAEEAVQAQFQHQQQQQQQQQQPLQQQSQYQFPQSNDYKNNYLNPEQSKDRSSFVSESALRYKY